MFTDFFNYNKFIGKQEVVSSDVHVWSRNNYNLPLWYATIGGGIGFMPTKVDGWGYNRRTHNVLSVAK